MKLELLTVVVTNLEQNCIILFDPDSRCAAVVDPGGEVSKISRLLAAYYLQVERIVLTHGHHDHVGGATELADRTGAQILGPHKDDSFLLSAVEEESQGENTPKLRNVKPDRFLAEGDEILLANSQFTVFHCPGHTPGHVIFLSREQRLAIVGDVLFRGSVGRTDFPYGNHMDLMRSIGTKLMCLDDDITVICGHGEFSTIGHERRNNPFMPEISAFIQNS